MVQQFTWQEFLIAALVLTIIWYAAVILLFYRKEMKAFLNKKQVGKSEGKSLPHRWEKDVDLLEEDEQEELMGRSKMPEGMTTVSMGDVGFAGDDDREDRLGLIPDVLEEVKSIFSILAKEDGNKKDFFSLMKLVREKYPKIGAHPSVKHINGYISEHAPFHLSPEELENLWD